MNRVLPTLIQRLCSPHVALRLQKSEACLAISAVGFLGSEERKNGMYLCGRLSQLAPTMTIQDLGVIAAATNSLDWIEPAVLDAAALRLFHFSSTNTQTQLRHFSPIINLFGKAAGRGYVNFTALSSIQTLQVDLRDATPDELAECLRGLRSLVDWISVPLTGKSVWILDFLDLVMTKDTDEENIKQLRATITDRRLHCASVEQPSCQNDARKAVVQFLLGSSESGAAVMSSLMNTLHVAHDFSLLTDTVLVHELDKRISYALKEMTELPAGVAGSLARYSLASFPLTKKALSEVPGTATSALTSTSEAQQLLARRSFGLDSSQDAHQSAVSRIETLALDELVATTCALIPQCSVGERDALLGRISLHLASLRDADIVGLLASMAAAVDKELAMSPQFRLTLESVLRCIKQRGATASAGATAARLRSSVLSDDVLSSLCAECALQSLSRVDKQFVSDSFQTFSESLFCIDALRRCDDSHLFEAATDACLRVIVDSVRSALNPENVREMLLALEKLRVVDDGLIDAICDFLRKITLSPAISAETIISLACACARANVLELDWFITAAGSNLKDSFLTAKLSLDAKVDTVDLLFSCGFLSEAKSALSSLSSLSLQDHHAQRLFDVLRRHSPVMEREYVTETLAWVFPIIINMESALLREQLLVDLFAHSLTSGVDVSKCTELDSLSELEVVIATAEPAAFARAVQAVCLSSWESSAKLDFLNKVMIVLPERCNRIPAELFASTISALGGTGLIGFTLAHHLAVDRLSDFATDHVEKFQTDKAASDILRGFASMQCTKRALFNVFASVLSLRPVFDRLTSRGISSAVKSFSSSKYVDLRLIGDLGKKVLKVKDLKATDACDVVRGFSRLALHDDLVYHELGQRVTASLSEIASADAVMMLAAYAHVGVSHENLLEAVMVSSCADLSSLDANSAATLFVTAWQMNFSGDVELLEKIADHIASNAESLTGESVRNVCLVLQELSWRHGKLLVALGSQASRLSAGNTLPPQTCRIVLDTLGTFLVNHTQARETLAAPARTVSRDVIEVSEQEMDEIKRKALGSR
jgi:hypothetical protein